MGGYVMAPAVAAARLRGIPYVLHEKDVRPGLATRIFAGAAAAVCTTLPGTERRIRTRRIVLTGVPLRDGFEPRIPAVPVRRLLITGGSQGARNLNNAVWGALDALCERFEEVVHVAGRQGAEGVASHQRQGYRGLAFVDDMQSLMGGTDLVVSRAGVGTIAELTAVGLPMVLVPGTFGGGHQEENAAAMVEAGAAVSIGDAQLTPGSLLSTLDSLTPEQLRAMAKASSAAGRRDAAKRVLDVLKEVVKG
jgi:UDP-N-acetylglucosamine:LPS N-acetylglucosamine transferase